MKRKEISIGKERNRVGALVLLYILTLLPLTMGAQPAARRAAQQKSEQTAKKAVSTRAQISFPTSAAMPEDAAWRRDIYRELDLNESANAGLYYPEEPIGTQMNLFTYLFRLVLSGQLKAYEYRLDGNELFTDSARIKPLVFLKDYGIFYERVDGKLRIDNSDIPSREVKSYYIKESAYFDQVSATYHTKVVALCPIMTRDDDFDGIRKTPLFWVKYDDVAPFLSKHQLMTSDLNNAATMSADDYFTKNMYKGKIYKTTNMLGQTLAQYCDNDSALAKEQQRIEGELKSFEKNLWGNQARKDSLDSIANQKDQPKVKAKKASAANRRTAASAEKTTKVKTKKSSSSSPASSGSSSARVTVRRQRH